MIRFYSFAAALLAALCLPACSSMAGSDTNPDTPGADLPSPKGGPLIDSFTAESSVVFVGTSTQLTAVFTGDRATVDLIGPVQSGGAVDTGSLAKTTTFTLTVQQGADSVQAQLTVQANYQNRVRRLADAPVGQAGNLAMALPDGTAIVMGGNASIFPRVPDSLVTQFFDPSTETFSTGPDLAFSVVAHEFSEAAPLANGSFVIAEGGINTRRRQSQLYDPIARTFSTVGDLNVFHLPPAQATALNDGSVLLTGRPEIFAPKSGHWTRIADMVVNRRGHSATLLNDGTVLIVGGFSCCTPTGEFPTGAAEIFDPVAQTFSLTGSLATPRAVHAATLLVDGRVLITGGIVDQDASTSAAEIFDPSTGEFGPAGNLQFARNAHSAILLTDGRVLIVGGEGSTPFIGVEATEIFDPSSGTFSLGPSVSPAFFTSTATLLANGKVLIFGGQDPFPVSAAFIFE